MVYDLIPQVKEVLIYKRDFILWKDQWISYPNSINLKWKSVKFDETNKNSIPQKKGLYAFCVEPRIAGLNSIGYLMYIGETGQGSEHNLRKRFEDYLRYKKRPIRNNIHILLNTWDGFIYFHFVEIDSIETNLKKLETKLLDTFVPPFNRAGFSAEIGQVLRELK